MGQGDGQTLGRAWRGVAPSVIVASGTVEPALTWQEQGRRYMEGRRQFKEVDTLLSVSTSSS